MDPEVFAAGPRAAGPREAVAAAVAEAAQHERGALTAMAVRIAKLLGGDATARQAAYRELDVIVPGVGSAQEATDTAKGIVGPLVERVLCAGASVVGAAEWMQACAVLVNLMRSSLAVTAECMRDYRLLTVWTSPASAPGLVFAKGPADTFTQEDALLAASAGWAVHACMFAQGVSAANIAAGLNETEAWVRWISVCPLFQGVEPTDEKNERILRLLLDVLRNPPPDLTDHQLGAAWDGVICTTIGRPTMAKVAHEGGCFELVR